MRAKESRPAGNRAAIKTLDGVTDESTDWAELVQRADHALVVLTGLRRGGTRRNVYFSLPSAQAALARAAARGVAASVTLVRLVPVPFVALDEFDGEGGAR